MDVLIDGSDVTLDPEAEESSPEHHRKHCQGRDVPCRLRGTFPTPKNVCMKNLRLEPLTWTNNHFRMGAWPSRCVRRMPPVS